jgi:hypothetical protein
LNPRTYCAVSALAFSVVAAEQLLRALNGWAVLAVWGFRQAPRSS